MQLNSFLASKDKVNNMVFKSRLKIKTLCFLFCYTSREKIRDYDFLSSIEILILDQADVFIMQNWEHLQVRWQNIKHLISVESTFMMFIVETLYVFRKFTTAQGT